MKSELVCGGIRFGEGPVWDPTSGTLVVMSVVDGAVHRVWPEAHRHVRIADTGGGANGAALADDGSVLITQNGGIDYMPFGLYPDPPPYRPVTPGLQRMTPEGDVTYLADVGFHAPNDLAVGPDDRIYFTDPGHHPPDPDRRARVLTLDGDGVVEVFADGFLYCNGIAFDREGEVVVVEESGLQRVHADGSREWVIEHLGAGGGDGFCLDVDGRFYVASTIEHGIRVVDPDGTIVDFLPIEGQGLVTNCCFGGPEGRDLFATDALPGDVVVFEGMPTAGLPVAPWSAPA